MNDFWGFPDGASDNLLVSAGDLSDAGSIPRLGRFPRGRQGNSLQYFWLKNPMGP